MSFFSSFSSFSSIFSQQISTIDPLSFTMYWEEKALVVRAHVQGLTTEEVSLEVRGSKLVLIVHDGVRRRCIQSCQLPENVNVGQCKTEINEDGLFTVRVPKQEEPAPPRNMSHAPVSDAAHCRRGRFFC